MGKFDEDKYPDWFFEKHNISPHYVKKKLKCTPVGHYDIYKGKTVTIRDKDGKVVRDTKLTEEEFIAKYKDKGEAKDKVDTKAKGKHHEEKNEKAPKKEHKNKYAHLKGQSKKTPQTAENSNKKGVSK